MPLQPGETRVVNLRVDAIQRDFTGQVVSDTGEPLAGARVQISQFGEEGAMGNRTDSEGRFTLGSVGKDEMVVCVRADGWARFVDTHYRIPNRGPVQIVMERGRTVRIDVQDSSGAPMANVLVLGRLPGAGVSKFGHDYTDATGRCTLKTVPTREFPLELEVSGRVFRHTLPYGVVDHIVEIPDWQTCRVRVSGESAVGSSKCRVGLRPVVPEGWETETQWLDLNSVEVMFRKVFPGTYEVFLERSENGGRRWTSDPVGVEVTEDTPAEVVLRG